MSSIVLYFLISFARVFPIAVTEVEVEAGVLISDGIALLYGYWARVKKCVTFGEK